jgi:hypothetical protein
MAGAPHFAADIYRAMKDGLMPFNAKAPHRCVILSSQSSLGYRDSSGIKLGIKQGLEWLKMGHLGAIGRP